MTSLGDVKMMWRTAKEIAGLPTGKTTEYPPTMETGKGQTNDEQEIADSFNKFFVSVGPTLAQNLDASKFKITVETKANSMCLIEITTQEVTNYLLQLQENKSTGPDDISPRMLKNLAEVIAEPICNIFKQSMNSGICPEAFKIAHVVPVYKQGDRKILTNYRPISLILVLANVFEKCLSVRLLQYLENIDFFAGSQFGFRKNKSTLDALHELTTFIRNSLHGSRKCAGIFLDLKNAFDTLNHKLLLRKLYNIGIRGRVYDIFKSYLTNRRQKTRYKTTFS